MFRKKSAPGAQAASQQVGIYVHIPFCRSKCDYCDFYSLPGMGKRMDQYLKALKVHIRETAGVSGDVTVDTVYFGGGTPTVFGADRLAALLKEIFRDFKVEKDAEITFEANPESVTPAGMKLLRSAGFNRVSLGMQSACPEELVSIRRLHTAEQTRAAVTAAREAGFESLNLDLIFGLPEQTMERWQQNVEAALEMHPEHMSCYCLDIEDGTPMAARAAAGEKFPDDDTLADMYLWMTDRLAQEGLAQYEISNFAREGRQSRHNLRYWLMRPYLGFGPSAHSDFGGRRYSFVRSLNGYIEGVLEGKPILASNDLLPMQERSSEYLMLRLRTVHGIEEEEYRSLFYMDFAPIREKMEEFQRHGWAEQTPEGRWHFTPEGCLISNSLIVELLERQEMTMYSDMLPRARARFTYR